MLSRSKNPRGAHRLPALQKSGWPSADKQRATLCPRGLHGDHGNRLADFKVNAWRAAKLREHKGNEKDACAEVSCATPSIIPGTSARGRIIASRGRR